jgi:hypothetical protein
VHGIQGKTEKFNDLTAEPARLPDRFGHRQTKTALCERTCYRPFAGARFRFRLLLKLIFELYLHGFLCQFCRAVFSFETLYFFRNNLAAENAARTF